MGARLIVSEVFHVAPAGVTLPDVALVVKQCHECDIIFALPMEQRKYVCPNGHEREEGPRYDDFIMVPDGEDQALA